MYANLHITLNFHQLNWSMHAICISDVHGNEVNFRKLCGYIRQYLPELVFIAGDILPNYYVTDPEEFIKDFLTPLLSGLKSELKDRFPAIYFIFGNDDPASALPFFDEPIISSLMTYINMQVIENSAIEIGGYACIPPTPFLLKDWEKYDISRYVPRGGLTPEEGIRTVEIPMNIIKHTTIADDLEILHGKFQNVRNSICLFHAPPYDTNLDKMKGMDINGNLQTIGAGSIAIRRFIEKYKPAVTLHGHIHESAAISGSWQDRLGDTFCFSAGHDGEELALVSFDTSDPSAAERLLL